MKYKCKECEHEFEGLSFINKCEKCSSDNIYRKAKKSSNTIWIILLILLIGLSLIVYNLFNEKADSSEETISYSSIFHTITNGNEVNFFLVVASDSDTIEYDHKEYNWLKLEITQETRNYTAENNTIYPCNPKTIRYQWDNTGLMKADKLVDYIDKNDFPEDFSPSNKAECPVEWRITMVSAQLDEDCNFTVNTDHPDNLQPELSESTKKELRSAGVSESDIKTFKDTDLTYYTKGKKIIKISITGKKGPYRYKNKWKLEKGNNNINIWAISTNFNDTMEYIHNGIRFDTTCFVKSVDSLLEGSEMKEGEVCEKCGEIHEGACGPECDEKKRKEVISEVISHYKGILTDVENNWEGVYDYSGDVVLNGNSMKSMPMNVIRAIDEGKSIVVKPIVINCNVVKVILEIK